MMKFLILLILIFNCSQNLRAAQAEAITPNTSAPQVGMLYLIWHCAANNPAINKVIDTALVNGDWGKIPNFQWRDTPAVTGNITDYCTAKRSLIEKHMDMLEAAKIDYLVVDFTNQCYLTAKNADCGIADDNMMESFKLLLEVSSARKGKIKIVPWVPFRGELHIKLVDMMDKFPDSQFYFQGKPLVIASWDVTRKQNDVGDAIENIVKRGKNVKKMWGLHNGSLGPDVWSFMEQCIPGFKNTQGYGLCGQYTHPELSSVSAAYQETYMTNFATAVPKFSGRTFLRQMETAMSKGSPLILINAWNEWIAQRFCLDSNGNHTHLCYDDKGNNIGNHFPDGRPVFVDLYTREYSRDFEPDTKSSEYYQLLQSSVQVMKNGKTSSQPAASGSQNLLSEAQAKEYLDLNPDVKAAYNAKAASDNRSLVAFASDHYNAFSEIEGRPRTVDEYIDCNPDVGYGFKDPKVNTNTDNAKTDITAFVAKHFQLVVSSTPVAARKTKSFGCMNLVKYWNCYADIRKYCTAYVNGDPYPIEAAKKCVFNHYRDSGKAEGRDAVTNCSIGED